MTFRKTLFFEIPSKNFIIPVYTEDDINTLRSFLKEDEILFSIGFKSEEDENGYYYIGQVKEFTELFQLTSFPLIYRKRIVDVLNGLENEPKYIKYDLEPFILKKIVYFQMTKNGPKVFIENDNEENRNQIKRLNLLDYFIKEFEVYLTSNTTNLDDIIESEIFYRIKNPNY